MEDGWRKGRGVREGRAACPRWGADAAWMGGDVAAGSGARMRQLSTGVDGGPTTRGTPVPVDAAVVATPVQGGARPGPPTVRFDP
jgi:hypothetical protein